jgi:hypothetical protein
MGRWWEKYLGAFRKAGCKNESEADAPEKFFWPPSASQRWDTPKLLSN